MTWVTNRSTVGNPFENPSTVAVWLETTVAERALRPKRARSTTVVSSHMATDAKGLLVPTVSNCLSHHHDHVTLVIWQWLQLINYNDLRQYLSWWCLPVASAFSLNLKFANFFLSAKLCRPWESDVLAGTHLDLTSIWHLLSRSIRCKRVPRLWVLTCLIHFQVN